MGILAMNFPSKNFINLISGLQNTVPPMTATTPWYYLSVLKQFIQIMGLIGQDIFAKLICRNILIIN